MFLSRYYCIGCEHVTQPLPSEDLRHLKQHPEEEGGDSGIMLCPNCQDELYSFAWGWNEHPDICKLTQIPYTD